LHSKIKPKTAAHPAAPHRDPAPAQLNGWSPQGLGAQWWTAAGPPGLVSTHTASAPHPAGVPGQRGQGCAHPCGVTCHVPPEQVAVPPQRCTVTLQVSPGEVHASPSFGVSAGHEPPPAPLDVVLELAPPAPPEVVEVASTTTLPP
jgi:hypothetical protein